MKYFISFLFVAMAFGSEPQSPAVKQAIVDYEFATKLAKSAYEKHLADALTEFKQQLDAATKIAMKNGDLNEANRIDALKKNTVIESIGAVVYLSDLEEQDVATLVDRDQLRYFTKKGISPFGKIQIDGKYSPNGIFLHPPSNGVSRISYSIKGYQRFLTSVGIDNSIEKWSKHRSDTPITFVVYGDGKELWRSKPVQLNRSVQNCDVDISKVTVLKLTVECPGGCGFAQAVWIEPRLQK